jgi:MFS family permease
MHRPEGLANIVRTLRNPHYRTFTIGKFSSQLTVWMYRMAIGWMVWDMTHSSAWLGLFGFIDYAPAMVVTPLAGAWCDRIDRMKFLRVTQALLLIHALVLSFLISFDYISIELLALLTLVFGIITAAQMPASQAIVPNLVARDCLTTAYGLNSLIMNVSRFMGPMIAGFMMVAWGSGPVILANAVGAGVFSICLAFMTREIKEGFNKSHGSLIADIREGLGYVRQHEGLGPMLLILVMLSILTFPILQLLPSFAGGVFNAGPEGLSWLIAMLSAGAFCQASYLASRGHIAGLTAYIIKNFLVMGLGFVLLTLTDNFWFGLVGVFVIGVATSADKAGALTLIQYATDGNMRGRVASFFSVIHHGGPAIGSVLLGVSGDLFGIRPTIAAAGILTVAVWAWAVYKMPTMAPALEAGPRDEPEEATASNQPEQLKPVAAQ